VNGCWLRASGAEKLCALGASGRGCPAPQLHRSTAGGDYGHHAARRTATTGEAPGCVPSMVPSESPGDL
jgi:hypothetical protein